jgi:hypothetical protein
VADLVVVIAPSSALPAAGVAGARAVADTTVTIRPEGSDYFGTVRSDRPARCADGRKIVLFKQKADSQSPATDAKIGMDTVELTPRHSAGSHASRATG